MLEALTTSQRAIVSLSRWAHTPAGVSLTMCTTDEFYRAFPQLMVRNEDWAPASAALMKWARADHAGVRVSARAREEELPTIVPVAPKPAQNIRVLPKPAANSVEARIRELSGSELVACAKANGVNTEVHPTNGGITAMRRKNALLALLRRGTQIKL